MKKRKPATLDNFSIEAPKQDIAEKVLCIRLSDFQTPTAVDKEAIAVSQEYPHDIFLTVYKNGTPIVTSFRELFSDELLNLALGVASDD